MRYTVPEDIGSSLRKMEGVAVAEIQSLIFGKSSTGNPKLTVKYVLTEELDGTASGEGPTTGETVLETFSLQPQALWKLNDLYKSCTGERIPQGDFSQEEFEQLLSDALLNMGFNLVLNLAVPNDGKSTDERTEVGERTPILTSKHNQI